MAQLPKGGLVRGHDKPVHWSCAIYFPAGVHEWLVFMSAKIYRSSCGSHDYHSTHVDTLKHGCIAAPDPSSAASPAPGAVVPHPPWPASSGRTWDDFPTQRRRRTNSNRWVLAQSPPQPQQPQRRQQQQQQQEQRQYKVEERTKKMILLMTVGKRKKRLFKRSGYFRSRE